MLNRARYPSLSGRVVFITGGGTGIGEHSVKAFCEQGSAVAFVDIKEVESRKLCGEIESESGRAPLFIPCDLRNIEALRDAVEETRQTLGNIAVLLNNAAADTRHDFAEVAPEYWDDRMAVNLRHAFFAAQAVYPQMRALGHGSIINFGSMSWMAKQGGMPGYTTSKADLHGMTCGLAKDFGGENIRVNTLVPGWVMTQRQLDLWVDEEAEKTIDTNQCLARRLMPDDIANAAMFLSADDSAMITGQSFVVDGGTLYHCSSATREVFRFDLQENGTLSDKQIFFRLSPDDGYPDGITVDTDGGLWVALVGLGNQPLLAGRAPGPEGLDSRGTGHQCDIWWPRSGSTFRYHCFDQNYATRSRATARCRRVVRGPIRPHQPDDKQIRRLVELRPRVSP